MGKSSFPDVTHRIVSSQSLSGDVRPERLLDFQA